MKLLIFIPSPRNDPEFAERIAKLPHDKIWMKYHSYDKKPYQKAREFFLKRKKYTHFAICPDDLMVTEKGVAKLWSLAKKYPVIMGTCNVSPDDSRLAMTHNLPSLDRNERDYKFYDKSEVTGKIITVPWCGTPFAIFTRKIIEKIELNGDGPYNPGKTAFAYDVGIAHDLKRLKVPIKVDTSVNFFHKRHVYPVLNDEEYPTWWYDVVGKMRISDPIAPFKNFQAHMEIFRNNGGSEKVVIDNILYAMEECIGQVSKIANDVFEKALDYDNNVKK